jgi:hypothetical protein
MYPKHSRGSRSAKSPSICWRHSVGGSRSRSTPMPRGRRPSTYARFEQLGELQRRHGTAEIITLRLVTFVRSKKSQLLLRFHALCNNSKLETPGHAKDRGHNGGVVAGSGCGCRAVQDRPAACQTLVRRMGIEALYRRPRTTKLAAREAIMRPNRAGRWTLPIPMECGFVFLAVVLHWATPGSVVAAVDHDGNGLLRGAPGRCLGSSREAGDRLGIHQRARQHRHRHQHGKRRSVLV